MIDSSDNVRRLREDADRFAKHGDMFAASIQDQAASAMATRLLAEEKGNRR